MKKLITLIITLMLLTSALAGALAETTIYKGTAAFVMSSESNVEGVKEVDEDVPHLVYQVSERKYPGGVMPDGSLIRAKSMSMVDIGLGFTTLKVQIELFADASALATQLVNEDLLTTANIIEHTLYTDGKYAAHVFFTSRDNYASIGRVIFSNGAWCYLYVGMWEGDNVVRLGFKAGVTQIPSKPEPTPTPAPAPAPKLVTPSEQTHTKPQSACTPPKVCKPDININVGLFQCIKTLFMDICK